MATKWLQKLQRHIKWAEIHGICGRIAYYQCGFSREIKAVKSSTGKKPMTIMVNDIKYYSTYKAVSVEVDDSVIEYTTSYAVEGVPRKNGEANFNLGTPYAILEDDLVVVLIDGEWIEFSSELRPQ